MNLLSHSINIMMPFPSTGFTIDATPIIIIGALIVLVYTVFTIKRSMNNKTTVNDTSPTNDNLDTINPIKQDTIINVDTQNDSSEDNLEEEELYENYEDDTEKVFTLNRR